MRQPRGGKTFATHGIGARGARPWGLPAAPCPGGRKQQAAGGYELSGRAVCTAPASMHHHGTGRRPGTPTVAHSSMRRLAPHTAKNPRACRQPAARRRTAGTGCWQPVDTTVAARLDAMIGGGGGTTLRFSTARRSPADKTHPCSSYAALAHGLLTAISRSRMPAASLASQQSPAVHTADAAFISFQRRT